jgi:hypothetical protein
MGASCLSERLAPGAMTGRLASPRDTPARIGNHAGTAAGAGSPTCGFGAAAPPMTDARP